MTLRDYFTVVRRRWPIIVACAVVAAAVMWFLSPANSARAQVAPSYTATATLVVGGGTATRPVSLDRIALYVKTGEIPTKAAAELGYQGEPALLASQIEVTPDPAAVALTIAASAPDGAKAAATANAFANQTVEYFKQSRAGAGGAQVSVLQTATPIPDDIGGGFVLPPSRPLRAALAMLIGALLGFALALIVHRLDSRLRTREEVHSALHLPIIAEVPRLSQSQRRDHAITVATEPLAPYSDAYRAARTALMHTASTQASGSYRGRRASLPDDRPQQNAGGARLILVTSANPAEGKTTTVGNLAASFAETGMRVLVLDADLRSPDTHNMLDVPQGAGLSDFVSYPDAFSLESLMRPTSLPGVRIITAGTRLAHPESLSSRLGHLLVEIRDMADVVLIDSAPLLAASDVFDILPAVDTVLLVVRSGRLTDVAARRVSELLGRFRLPMSGVVLVGVKGRRADGYGYGYGSAERKKQKRSRAESPVDPALVGPPQGVSQQNPAPQAQDWSASAEVEPSWTEPAWPDVGSEEQASNRRAGRSSPTA